MAVLNAGFAATDHLRVGTPSVIMTDYAETISLNTACNGIAERILSDLGLKSRRDGTIRCKCPVHGGNNPSAFYYNPETYRWYCWTNNCHYEFGGDWIGLVRGINNCSFGDAVKYLYDNYFPDGNIPYVEVLSHTLNRIRSTERKYLDNAKYKFSAKGSPYFERRKVSPETLERFEVFECHDPDKTLYGRAIAPVYDCDGKLVSFTGRALNESWTPKWMHWPKDNDSRTVVYGLHITKSYIVDGHFFLVEGPLDVWGMFDKNIKNVGALLGLSVNNLQCQELVKAGVRQVTLLLDPDPEGIKASVAAANKLSLFFRVNNLTEVLSDDPGEIAYDELMEICSGK